MPDQTPQDLSKERQKLTSCQRWVVKIGSSLLTDNGHGLDEASLHAWVKQMADLRQSGVELVVVSSGAVAAGMTELGWTERPKAMHELQAAAAIGQMGLVKAWQTQFAEHGLRTAQILLTHDDLSDRKRYLNARSTLRALLELGVIPIVNENDTVATDEFRFGDNDTLGALVTNLVEGHLLVILTDRDGMFDADPRQNPDAQLIHEARSDDNSLDEAAGATGGNLGRGGMQTKLRASRLAARSGAYTVIADGRQPAALGRLQQGERLGTLMIPDHELLAARKQWLAGHLQMRGRLVLDDGAVKALTEGHKSLLPVGVTELEGTFRRGEMVVCVDRQGQEVARGLSNYSAFEAQKIIGHPSDDIEQILGYTGEPDLVHRDNLVLV